MLSIFQPLIRIIKPNFDLDSHRREIEAHN
jgi:hypothetical protein